jgi:ubiquinone/menaquinone biosynthesis C-methylase UbiE
VRNLKNSQPIVTLDFDYYEIKNIDRKLSEKYAKPNTLFCDVGGAGGTDAFNFLLKGAEGVCVDISSHALRTGCERAKKNRLENRIGFVKASATDLPFPISTFDLTTSFSVIDHIPPKRAAYHAIGEFARITKYSGYVSVTVPNKLFLLGTVVMRARMLLQPNDGFFEQRFTPKELARCCTKIGLQIIEYDSKYPTVVGNTIMNWYLPRIVLRIPLRILYLLSKLGTAIFNVMEKNLKLRLLGARYGFTAIRLCPLKSERKQWHSHSCSRWVKGAS